MSSILKALQRVEQDQPAGAAPGAPRRAVRGDFVAEQGAPLLRRSRRRAPRGLRLWAVAGAVLLLAALVWWRLPERSRPELAAPSTPQEASAPVAVAEAKPPPQPAAAVVAPPAPAPAAAFPVPAPPAAEAAPEPLVPNEVAERLPPLGTTLDVPDAAPPPAPEPEPAQVARAAPAVPALEEPAPEPKLAEPERAAPPPAPPPAVERAAPAPPPAPVKRAAPKPEPPRTAAVAPPPRPSAPAVLVERTRWHPSPERRVASVLVEGQPGPRELHEGDAVGALVVKEIKPSSVVFLHGADTLSRRVGVRE